MQFDNSWYSDLPKSIQEKVCTCLEKPGWSKDPNSEWWICSKCRKPSRYSAVYECDDCEEKFMPSEPIDTKFEVICNDCA